MAESKQGKLGGDGYSERECLQMQSSIFDIREVDLNTGAQDIDVATTYEANGLRLIGAVNLNTSTAGVLSVNTYNNPSVILDIPIPANQSTMINIGPLCRIKTLLHTDSTDDLGLVFQSTSTD